MAMAKKKEDIENLKIASKVFSLDLTPDEKKNIRENNIPEYIEIMYRKIRNINGERGKKLEYLASIMERSVDYLTHKRGKAVDVRALRNVCIEYNVSADYLLGLDVRETKVGLSSKAFEKLVNCAESISNHPHRYSFADEEILNFLSFIIEHFNRDDFITLRNYLVACSFSKYCDENELEDRIMKNEIDTNTLSSIELPFFRGGDGMFFDEHIKDTILNRVKNKGLSKNRSEQAVLFLLQKFLYEYEKEISASFFERAMQGREEEEDERLERRCAEIEEQRIYEEMMNEE